MTKRIPFEVFVQRINDHLPKEAYQGEFSRKHRPFCSDKKEHITKDGHPQYTYQFVQPSETPGEIATATLLYHIESDDIHDKTLASTYVVPQYETKAEWKVELTKNRRYESETSAIWNGVVTDLEGLRAKFKEAIATLNRRDSESEALVDALDFSPYWE